MNPYLVHVSRFMRTESNKKKYPSAVARMKAAAAVWAKK